MERHFHVYIAVWNGEIEWKQEIKWKLYNFHFN